MASRWDKDQIQEVRKLLERGLKIQEIAHETGHTDGQVRGIIQRNNLAPYRGRKRPLPTRNRWTDECTATMKQMVADGHSLREVAKELDQQFELVRYHAKKHNIMSVQGQMIQEQKQLKEMGLRKCFVCDAIKPNDIKHFRTRNNRSSACLECLQKDAGAAMQLRLQHIKARSQKKGLAFDLDLDFLTGLFDEQGGRCYYTGERMMIAGELSLFSLSVDRKVPEKGYTKGNVVLCCNAVNTMKYTMDDNQLLYWCRKVVEGAR